MMRKNKFQTPRLIFIFLLIIPVCLHAKLSDLQATSLMPVEWQAIRLQESIEEKIIRSLNPIIKESDYVIEVKISVDTDEAEDPSSKKITKTLQSKKVRFTTSEFPKDGDDFVVFNKLGLEAPMVGDDPIETGTSEVELAQKAIIEMNDRYNIFNFLDGIDIKLTFDKGLTTKTRENVQKIIQGLSFNTKDIIPQINVQYLELKDSRVKTDELKKPLAGAAVAGAGGGKSKLELPDGNLGKWGEHFKNLDVMIGLIIGSLVLGFVAIFISIRGSKQAHTLESNNHNTNEGSSASTNLDDESENPEEASAELLNKDGENMGIDLNKIDAQTKKISDGLERFRKMMDMHFNDVILLIKGWIRAGKGQEASALKGLVAVLSDKELSEIFKVLSIDERSLWKMCLDSEMNKDELAKSFTFISNKIIEVMMVPSLIDDYEICDLLLSLKAEDASRFCIDHPELGAIFANVLSAKTIGEMFTLMPEDLTSDIIEKSSMFKKEEIVAMMPLLKETLLEVKLRRERPPFLARIFDILPTAKAGIEMKLYSTLIQYCDWEDVKQTALKVLPRELVNNLPEAVYKGVIGSMPLETQVVYFAVQDEDERETNLNRFSASGAKNREMLEIEIDVLLKNELTLRRLQGDKKAGILEDFLIFARKYISINMEAQQEMRSEVETWLKNIREEMNDEDKLNEREIA